LQFGNFTGCRIRNCGGDKSLSNEFLAFLGCDSIVDIKLPEAVELEMSVLFSDIRDFTTFSEQMTPPEKFKFINYYLSLMEPLIWQIQRFINK
jgi:hypothetical protein